MEMLTHQHAEYLSSLYCRSMPSPEALLRAIARDEKKRVQRCEFYDRNVCDFEFTDMKVRVDPISKKFRVSAPLIRSGGRLLSRSN